MAESEATQIGLRIREVRTQRGCSLPELAERTGIGQSTLKSIEHGKNKLTLETIITLSKTLDVSMDYLVLGIRPQTNSWGLILHSDEEDNIPSYPN